jgi:transposase
LFIKKESKMPRPHTPKPPYPAQFRQQMVELVQAGRKPSELAKEFNCHATSILNWVRQSGGSVPLVLPPNTQGQALSTAERQELIELRRKLRQVQMERDILAKATAWFAGKSEKTSIASTNS